MLSRFEDRMTVLVIDSIEKENAFNSALSSDEPSSWPDEYILTVQKCVEQSDVLYWRTTKNRNMVAAAWAPIAGGRNQLRFLFGKSNI